MKNTQGSSSANQLTPEKSKTENFVIEDLLDFPTDEMLPATDSPPFVAAGASTDSSTVVDSCSKSDHNVPPDNAAARRSNFTDTQFSHDLCVQPYDDFAELEWLSNVVEESFSSEDMQKLQLISGIKAKPNYASNKQEPETNNRVNNPVFNTDVSVRGKARTKRPRATPCNWSSRLLAVSPTSTSPSATMSSESESDIASSSIAKKTLKTSTKKKEVFENSSSNGDGRKCLHCSTDKTPQWRSGPMGPKTLCNACGVRYKSGRLVPEYRPASSPTFQLTKHSNSHRKVLELRRQKEMQMVQQHQQQHYIHHQNMMFEVPNNNDDYLIHQRIGPDYRQLI
ncbi:GATA transcription factor 12-like [Rutidosis leptorrhynchoides]|uniref:GATA transcription factor 12-like n=1 Tax=Rutidosis leptorrhynchoides TaxID=125765 RepID=UPI003A9A1A8C